MNFQRFGSNCTPHICYPNEFWFTSMRKIHDYWNTTNNNEFTVRNSRLLSLVYSIKRMHCLFHIRSLYCNVNRFKDCNSFNK
jgi:hypothetical protein